MNSDYKYLKLFEQYFKNQQMQTPYQSRMMNHAVRFTEIHEKLFTNLAQFRLAQGSYLQYCNCHQNINGTAFKWKLF